jgi:hypothetical protein
MSSSQQQQDIDQEETHSHHEQPKQNRQGDSFMIDTCQIDFPNTEEKKERCGDKLEEKEE